MPETITNSYFVDLDSDCLPELVLYRDGEVNRSMEVWKERGEKGFIMISSQSLPSVFNRDSMKVVGLPIFADMGKAIILYIIIFYSVSKEAKFMTPPKIFGPNICMHE